MEPVKLEKEKPYIISLSQTNNNIRKKPKVNVEEGKTGEEDKPEVVNKEPKETFSHDEEGEEDQNAPEKNVCIHAITLKQQKTRCRYWPTCPKGEDCEYWHPKEMVLILAI